MANQTDGKIPANFEEQEKAPPHFIVEPFLRDVESGGVWVLNEQGGFSEVVAPFAVEREHRAVAEAKEERTRHISDTRQFGDVDSWAAYLLRFGNPETALVSWNNGGLHAILDYHKTGSTQQPGYLDWKVIHTFKNTTKLVDWRAFCINPKTQEQAVQFLEQMADDIVDPPATTLNAILRVLRTTVTSKAESTLREDGSSKIEYSKDSTIKGSVELPPYFTINIPLLQGHTTINEATQAQKDVTYNLKVRLRIVPQDNAGVMVYATLQNLDAALENAYADQVGLARHILGDAYLILRVANTGS